MRVPLLNFEEDPGVPLLSFEGGPGFRVPGSKSPGPTFTSCIWTIFPEENCPLLGLRFGSRLRLVLGVGGNQAIAPEENCPLVKVFGLGAIILRGSCPRTDINTHRDRK